jgi:hypothetical protein
MRIIAQSTLKAFWEKSPGYQETSFLKREEGYKTMVYHCKAI